MLLERKKTVSGGNKEKKKMRKKMSPHIWSGLRIITINFNRAAHLSILCWEEKRSNDCACSAPATVAIGCETGPSSPYRVAPPDPPSVKGIHWSLVTIPRNEEINSAELSVKS